MEFDHSTDTISPDDQTVITFGGTGGLVLPIGTTAQRPAAANGIIRYNTDTTSLDFVINGAYRTVRGATTLAATGISAAGTTQGTATAITAAVNNVTTVASGTGVILPTPTAGDEAVVVNNGANALAVYPASGGAIGDLATNAAQSLAVGKVLYLRAVTATLWEIVSDTGAAGGGAVSSVTGTTNQITASPTTGAVVLSLPSTVIAPGTVQATSGFIAATGSNSFTSTTGTAIVVGPGAAATATSAGNNTQVRAGTGGGTSGTGGQLSLLGGAAGGGNSTGGQITMASGQGSGSASSGSILIFAAQAGPTGIGGDVSLSGGTGGATSGDGGPATLNGGFSNVGAGGSANVAGGGSSSGTGGAVTVSAGNTTDGNGGSVSITATGGAGTNRNGGDISISAGNRTGSGTAGSINLGIPATGTLQISGNAGSDGQVIRSNGSSAAPTWQSVPLSIAGTANQITASAATGAITLSIPSTFVAPGTVQATGSFIAGTISGSYTSGSGIAIQIIPGAATTTTATGNTLTLQGGPGGSTSGAGGNVTIQGGTPTAGAGGNVTITGATGVGTNQDGGDITIGGGASSGTGIPGTVSITGGAGGGTTTAGSGITIAGGNGGGTTGAGGPVTIAGGNAGSTAGVPGEVILRGGQSASFQSGGNATVKGGTSISSGPGGIATLSGGDGGTTAGAGGGAVVTGGTPTTSGAGGAVTITGTAGVGTNQNGGSVTITAGNPTGTGTPGSISLTAGALQGAGTPGTVAITGGAGTGATTGGVVTVTGGSGGSTGAGAAVTISGGAGGTTAGTGGSVTIKGGDVGTGSGGNVLIQSGNTGLSGNVQITAPSILLNGTNTGLVFTAVTTDPSAPSAGTGRLFSKDIAGRINPRWMGPSGLDYTLQATLAHNNIRLWKGGATTVATTFASTDGTMPYTGASPTAPTIPALASTNALTQTRRSTISTGAAAGGLAYIRANQTEVWRGNAAGLGGYYIVIRFAVSGTLQAGLRAFAGLVDVAANPTNIDPTTSTTPGSIGMAIAANTGNWRIVHNVTGAARTAVDLGANFAINNTHMLELALFCAPNASAVGYRVTNLSTGNVASGSISTNQPANTTFLVPSVWITNNATAAAQTMEFISYYVETDN